MPYSIELYFDDAFETKIRQLWDQLFESGVPSILHQIGSRPHLSLAVLEAIDEAQVSALLKRFTKNVSPFRIAFPATGLIPGIQKTVFLVPAANLTLLEMQSALYQGLQRNGFPPRDHYRPDQWLPHCTLSKELGASDALKTMGICQSSPVTGTAAVTEMGVIEFRPRREITTFKLAD